MSGKFQTPNHAFVEGHVLARQRSHVVQQVRVTWINKTPTKVRRFFEENMSTCLVVEAALWQIS